MDIPTAFGTVPRPKAPAGRPVAGARRAARLGAAVLALWAVACGGSFGHEDGVTVPDVRGLPRLEADRAIEDAGLVVGDVTEAHSATVPLGHVVDQAPLAGATVARGTAVDLVLSLGAESAVVPDVVGLARDRAERAIVDAGLVVGEVTAAHSETVARGHVIGQAPTGGEWAPRGSAVALVLSLGLPWVLESPYDFAGAHQHKVQLHVHTTDSDGDHPRSWVMQAYESLGYAAVAITDHDHSTHRPSLTDPGGHGIIHIPGVEYSGDDSNLSWSHMLGINIETILHDPGIGARQAQIDRAALEGGFTYLCHPYDESVHRRGWTADEVLSVESFTGIEIHNGGHYNTPDGRDYAFKVDLALVNGRRIDVIAVDDFHADAATTMDRGFVVVLSEASPEALELHHVVSALRSRNYFAAGRLSTSHPSPPRFLDISVDGLTLTVETDRLVDIEFATMRHNYFLEGDNWSQRDVQVSFARYEASPDDVFVRVTATYAEGGEVSYAWSNPIFVVPVPE